MNGDCPDCAGDGRNFYRGFSGKSAGEEYGSEVRMCCLCGWWCQFAGEIYPKLRKGGKEYFYSGTSGECKGVWDSLPAAEGR